MESKRKAALTDAKQITSSLQRVRENMAAGVMQADEAVNVLLQDGAIIQDSLHDHKYVLKTSLQTTKQRLDRIKSAERREKWSIFLSLSFFTSVVIYIIAKRTRLLTIGWLAMQGAIKGKDFLTSIASVRHLYDHDISVNNTISNNLSTVDVMDQEEARFFSKETVTLEGFQEKGQVIEQEELNNAKARNNPVLPTSTSISEQAVKPTTIDVLQVPSVEIKASNSDDDDDDDEFSEDAAGRHGSVTVEINNDGFAMNVPKETNSKTIQINPGIEEVLVGVVGEKEGTVITAKAMEPLVVVAEEVEIEGQDAMPLDHNVVTMSSPILEPVVVEEVGEDHLEANIDEQWDVMDGDDEMRQSPLSTVAGASPPLSDPMQLETEAGDGPLPTAVGHARHTETASVEEMESHQSVAESTSSSSSASQAEYLQQQAENQLSDQRIEELSEHPHHVVAESTEEGQNKMQQKAGQQHSYNHDNHHHQQQQQQQADITMSEQHHQQQPPHQQEVQAEESEAVLEGVSEQQQPQHQQEVQAEESEAVLEGVLEDVSEQQQQQQEVQAEESEAVLEGMLEDVSEQQQQQQQQEVQSEESEAVLEGVLEDVSEQQQQQQQQEVQADLPIPGDSTDDVALVGVLEATEVLKGALSQPMEAVVEEHDEMSTDRQSNSQSNSIAIEGHDKLPIDHVVSEVNVEEEGDGSGRRED